MKTFKFSLMLHTLENTDVFITLDENIYGIHSKRVNIFYVYSLIVLELKKWLLKWGKSEKNQDYTQITCRSSDHD